MIKHVVFFKFKADATPSDRKAALDGLKELPGKIDVIRSFEIGENVVASPRAWDVALIGEYDNLEALDVYIRTIRKKIEPDPSRPVYLHTVRGVGYRLAEERHPTSA